MTQRISSTLILTFIFQVTIVAQTKIPCNLKISGVTGQLVLAQDVNKDTWPELLIVDIASFQGTSTYFENDSNQGFDPGLTISTRGNVVNHSQAFGDLKGDGYMEIVLAGSDDQFQPRTQMFTFDSAIKKWLGQAHGVEHQWDAGLAWGDYDNDGDDDFVIAGWNGATLSTQLYNNSSGTLSPVTNTLRDVEYSTPHWVDIDLDNDLDLLIIGHDFFTGIDHTDLYFNDAGVFNDAQAGLQGLANAAIDFADIDGDSDVDFIMTGSMGANTSDTIILYRQGVSGSFTGESLPFNGVWNGSLFLRDLDGDNDHDLILAGGSSADNYAGTIRFFENDGTGDFSDRSPILPFSSVSDADMADFNGDDKDDIVIVGIDQSSGTNVMEVFIFDSPFYFASTSPSVNIELIQGNFLICDEGDSSMLVANRSSGISWYKDGSIITGATDDTLIVKEAGRYLAQFTQGATCMAVSNMLAIGDGSLPAGDLVFSVSGLHLIYNGYNSSNYDSVIIFFGDGDSSNIIEGTHEYKSVDTFNLQMRLYNVCGETVLDTSIELDCATSDSSFFVEACDSFTVPSSKATYKESGLYMDTIVNVAGCDSILSINLNIIKLDTALLIDSSSLWSLDSQASYQWLDCNNNYSILEGDTNQGFSASESGSFAVELRRESCIDTSTCRSVEISIACAISDSSIAVTSCDSFTVPSATTTYKESGFYKDTIINTAGCDSIISIDLNIIKLDTGLLIDSSTLWSLDSQALYQWLDCDDDFSVLLGDTNQSYYVTESGNYAAELRREFCIDTTSCKSVIITNLSKSAPEMELQIFPNPGSGIFYLKGNSKTIKGNWELYSMTGVSLLEISSINSGMSGVRVLDLRGIPAGVYWLIQVNSEYRGKQHKLIIQ